MNETARLLSPKNKDEIASISKEFYGHENSVIISQDALDKIEKVPDLGFRISDPFTVDVKHEKQFSCRFIDLPQEDIYKILAVM